MSTATSPPTATKMWLSDALVDIGPRLLANGKPDSVGKAISPLDRVRRFACLGDKAAMGRPPVLLTEAVEFESLSLYKSCLKVGSPDIHSVKDLCVAGGAIVETERCSFPVVVMHSKEENTLILHAAHAPLAALEAEFFDHAFSQKTEWEEMVAPQFTYDGRADYFVETVAAQSAPDGRPHYLVATRSNAAFQSRTQPFPKLPEAALGGESHVSRRGVVPFLSVRAVASQKERNLVGEHLLDAMSVIPASSVDLLDLLEDSENLILRTEFCSGAIGRKGPPRPPSKSAVLGVINRPIVAPLAVAVLQAARDETAGESKFVVPRAVAGAPLLGVALKREEETACLAASVKETDLQAELARDDAYTLPNVMASMSRLYATKLLASASGVDDVRELALLVAKAASTVFSSPDAAKFAEKAISGIKLPSSQTPRTTMTLAVKYIGSLVDPDHALVVAVREEDGRFSRVTLHNSKSTGNQNLSACALSRLACIFTRARVLIVDGKSVSELLVKEPPHAIEQEGLDKALLRFAEQPERTEAGGTEAGGDEVGGKMEKLCTLLEATAKQLEDTNKRVDALVSSNAALSREVSQLTAANGELAAAVKNAAPPAPARKRVALLDTLELVERLHKCIRV